MEHRQIVKNSKANMDEHIEHLRGMIKSMKYMTKEISRRINKKPPLGLRKVLEESYAYIYSGINDINICEQELDKLDNEELSIEECMEKMTVIKEKAKRCFESTQTSMKEDDIGSRLEEEIKKWTS